MAIPHDVASELHWMSEAGSQAGIARVTVDLRRSRMRIVSALAAAGWIFALALLAWVIFTQNKLKLLQRPLHAEIVPPMDITLAPVGAGAISISRDGSKMVMPVIPASGQATDFGLESGELLTLNLESGETKQLKGTAGGIFPFWSFDGASIGFFSDGKLKRIPANGGPSQVLADAPQGRGGSWGHDDTIIFAPNIFGPLMKIPAGGGQPAPVTTVREQNVSHRNPDFLNDGKHLLYTSRALSEQTASVVIASIGGNKETIVVDRGSNPQYANGYVFWVRDGNLLAQPWDPDSEKLSGAPIPIASNIEYFNPRDIGNFSVSPAGTLVWRRSNPVPFQLVKLDAHGHELQTIGEPALYELRDVDRSGHQALLAKTETSGATDLWIMDLERAQATRATFTSAPYGLIYGAFSPDGSKLAVASLSSTESRSTQSLWIQSTSGSGSQKGLLQSRFDVMQWSGDGKTLVGQLQDAHTKYDIEYLSIDDPSKLLKFAATPFEELNPELSPDGKWISWVSDESGHQEIYLSDFPAATRKWQISKGDSSSAGFWALEGNSIVYTRKDNKGIVYTPVTIGKNGLQLGSSQFIEMDMSAFQSGIFMLRNEQFLTMKALSPSHIEPIQILRNWKTALQSN